MIKRLLFTITFLIAAVVCISVNLVAHAEDDVKCKGRIEGVANQGNSNVGSITFDAHPGPSKIPQGAVYNKVTNLSIVGKGQGLAPGNRDKAACITKVNQEEYKIEGYAWSENIGFISFNCDDCGNNNYGVKISSPDPVTKERNLLGYAWNGTFGFMNFYCKDNEDVNGKRCGPHNYGVKVGADGKLSGYAYTTAGLYVNFSGVKLFIPGEEIQLDEKDPCKGNPICVRIYPDPDNLSTVLDSSSSSNDNSNQVADSDKDVSITGDFAKIADGKDFYQIHLFLRNADGSAVDIKEIDEIKFIWTDTVKADQSQGSTGSFGEKEIGEGIVYKPVIVNRNNFASIFEEADRVNSPGQYRLKQDKTIRSFAPTSNANLSYTTSTKPPFPVNNDVFFSKIGGKIPNIESNNLILNRVDVKLKGKEPLVHYPNGKTGLSFKFIPVYDVSLYANNFQDSILAMRNIPVSFKVKGSKNSKNFNYDSVKVDFNLDFDKNMSQNGNCTDQVINGFKFGFFDDPGVAVEYESLNSKQTMQAFENEQNLYAIAALGGEADCEILEGPSLHTMVTYSIGGKTYKYYSDKLPRLSTKIDNPTVTVHGNILASKAFSPDVAKTVQETGNVAVNVIRNTIHENAERKLKASVGQVNQKGNCKITALGKNEPKVTGCTLNRHYRIAKIDGDNVIYFFGSDVDLELGNHEGKWSIVVERGRLFINKDLYNANPQKLALVVLNPYSAGCGNSGNIYIHNSVKNIQANIFTDCSVFSYVDKNKIDVNTGLYKWSSFQEMIDSLNNQLKIEGSIASHNTIGGADSDIHGFLRDGFGKVYKLPVTPEVRMTLQQYDLNYLRLVKGELEYAENGLPIDQSCGKALTIEDMVEIIKYQEAYLAHALYGDSLFASPVMNNDKICDGIDSTKFVADEGDLVARPENLAQGLNDDELKPVYVIFSPADSFLFKSR